MLGSIRHETTGHGTRRAFTTLRRRDGAGVERGDYPGKRAGLVEISHVAGGSAGGDGGGRDDRGCGLQRGE